MTVVDLSSMYLTQTRSYILSSYSVDGTLCINLLGEVLISW